MNKIPLLVLFFTGITIFLAVASPLLAGPVPAGDALQLSAGIDGAHEEQDSFIYLPMIMGTSAPSSEPFSLIAPADGAQLETLVPYFEFERGENLPNDAGGCFALDTEPDPTQCSYSFSEQNEDYSFTIWYNLEPDTKYYWRVGALYNYDFDNIDWGEEQWSFVTAPAGGDYPLPPVLVAPADGATISRDTIALDWDPVANAGEYKFKVIDVALDRGWLGDGVFPPDSGVPNDALAVIWNYYQGPEFKWTVAVRNQYAWSDYAQYWYFTLEE